MRHRTPLRAIIAVLAVIGLTATPSLAAQISPVPDGITVIGTGRASAPADSTTLGISLSTGDYWPPTVPQADATPGAEEQQRAQSVVNALVGAGIPQESITVVTVPFLGNTFSGPYGPAMALVEVALDSPTPDALANVITAATRGAAQERLVANIISMNHVINGCAALQQEASQAAFDDATRRANAQAEILGVSLGNLVASRDSAFGPVAAINPLMGPFEDGSCTSMGDPNAYYGFFGSQPFDMTMEPVVTIYAMTEFTFEINPGEATPAA